MIHHLHGEPVHIFDRAAPRALGLDAHTLGVHPDQSALEAPHERPFLAVWDALMRSLESKADVERLILGHWDPLEDLPVEALIEAILPDIRQMTRLDALVLGDIDQDTLALPHIVQGEVGQLLAALPSLRYFAVRGGEGLRVESCRAHAHLDALIVESAHLAQDTIEDITSMDLPALTHLELWLGEEGDDGEDSVASSVDAVLSVARAGALQHLGFVNTAWSAPALATLRAHLPHARALEVLDLSLGTLTTEDANDLLETLERASLTHLARVDLSSNYIDQDALSARVKGARYDVALARQRRVDSSQARFTFYGA